MDAAEQPEFFNRELSWLKFNQRVLEEAHSAANPLLERVKFSSIFSSNLDEFFMKRVGGLKRQVLAHAPSSGLEHRTPQEQLVEIREVVIEQLQLQSQGLVAIKKLLREEGILLLDFDALSLEDRQRAQHFFNRSLFPVLTPLSVDPGHPFPFISNLSTSVGVLMNYPETSPGSGPGAEVFARIKIPSVFPSWLRVDGGQEDAQARFVSVHELIAKNLGALFPGMDVQDVMLFRITRNADIERDEEDADDLLAMVAEELRERRFAQVVRLEHGPCPNPRILRVLMEELELSAADVYELPIFLEYFSLAPIAALNRPPLKFPHWTPVLPAVLNDPHTNCFEVIRGADLLVHHPYESFTGTVERFIRTAVDDPRVMAIKMTLYRTGDDSPFIPLLIRAAEAGKQVVCLVELKARFDEERNILVAQALEKAGVHVVYGIVGLKTHCKLALVVRQEGETVRCYAHLGTGNYHSKTSLLYTDLGLFTADPGMTEDIVQLFHYLTGRSVHWRFRKLLVAPIDMRETFVRMIEREAANALAGLPAAIVAKMNSLEDPVVCRALIAASRKGVRIDLIVRGFCCLRPEIPENMPGIRVISVVGRFLEHSRIFHFRNGAEDPVEGLFFIGSADWMNRNLTARVEAIAPIEDRMLRARCWEILRLLLQDRRQCWELSSGGEYVRRQPGDAVPEPQAGAQELLMNLTRRD